MAFTRSWSRGLVGTVADSVVLSARFGPSGTNDDVMVVDSNDPVFSTNFDMLIDNLVCEATGGVGSGRWQIWYGPNLDSLTGATLVWTASNATTDAAITCPRTIALPKGNYLHITKTAGTANNVRFAGNMSTSQEVNTFAEVNGDMEGNLP